MHKVPRGVNFQYVNQVYLIELDLNTVVVSIYHKASLHKKIPYKTIMFDPKRCPHFNKRQVILFLLFLFLKGKNEVSQYRYTVSQSLIIDDLHSVVPKFEQSNFQPKNNNNHKPHIAVECTYTDKRRLYGISFFHEISFFKWVKEKA